MNLLGTLLLCVLFVPAALANDHQQEALRLGVEMQQLAARNVWDGVERNYEELLRIGAVPAARDHLLAASSAQHHGDVFAEILRLKSAKNGQDDPAVDARIDTLLGEFGRTVLTCRTGTATLAPAQAPFRPDFADAITFAQGQVNRSGHFNGFLPIGDYSFGDTTFSIAAHADPTSHDLRPNHGPHTNEAPKRATIGKTRLTLNGSGTYTAHHVELYLASLYLKKKSDDPNGPLRGKDPSRIGLLLIHEQMSQRELGGHFVESFRIHEHAPMLRERVQQLSAMMEDVVAGDEVTFDWLPDEGGVRVTVKGQAKGSIQGGDFMRALWRHYIGTEADPMLRAQLLGL